MNRIYIILALCGYFYLGDAASYRFGDSLNTTCILMDINATFQLSVQEANETQEAPIFNLEGSSVVFSSSFCDETFHSPLLTVKLFPTDEQFQFTFRRKDNFILMKMILYLEPTKHFANVSKLHPGEMPDSVDLTIGRLSNTSYMCRSQQQVVFGQNPPFYMAMNITNLHVQAYNIENNEFGPTVECSKDVSTTPGSTNEHTGTTEPTTAPQSTNITSEPVTNVTHEPSTESTIKPETTMEPHTETTRIPTTTESHETPTYVVNDGRESCIVLKGDITFHIPYKTKNNQQSTAHVTLPSNARVVGTCNNVLQSIYLAFFEAFWVMAVDIKQLESRSTSLTEIHLADNSKHYSWERFQLLYFIDDDHFPDAENLGMNYTIQKDNLNWFETSMDGSYKCTADQNQTIDTVQLEFKNFQYRAFSTTNSTDFPTGDVTECKADSKDSGGSNKTLAIGLGAAFGALFVIILIAGLILRKRRKSQNEYNSL